MPPAEPSTSPTALQAHLNDCAAACGRWHRVGGRLQSLHAVLRPRLMSTLLALLLLLAVALWWA